MKRHGDVDHEGEAEEDDDDVGADDDEGETAEGVEKGTEENSGGELLHNGGGWLVGGMLLLRAGDQIFIRAESSARELRWIYGWLLMERLNVRTVADTGKLHTFLERHFPKKSAFTRTKILKKPEGSGDRGFNVL